MSTLNELVNALLDERKIPRDNVSHPVYYERKIPRDNVNHPVQYEGKTSLECIDVMEVLLGGDGLAWFCLGNAFKYLWRYKNKNGIEDLEKAGWYLDRVNVILKECGECNEELGDTWIKLNRLYKKIINKEAAGVPNEQPDKPEQLESK